jgi:hypothetical protein
VGIVLLAAALFFPESKAAVVMTGRAGKEVDTVVTVIAVVTILVDVLGQIWTVVVIIILYFSGVNHLPAAVRTILFYSN